MPLLAGVPSRRSVVDCGGLHAVRRDCCRSPAAVTSHDAPRTLAVTWPHPTRLETRTKESNMCASLRVIETPRQNESEGGLGR